MNVPHALSDIETRADCERLVRAFYAKALDDPIIGFIFVDVAKLDLEAHVPRITSFWETMLLGAQSYTGGAFHPHAELHAKVECARALRALAAALVVGDAVDELFAGDRADLAKATRCGWGAPFTSASRSSPPPPVSRRRRPDRDAARATALSAGHLSGHGLGTGCCGSVAHNTSRGAPCRIVRARWSYSETPALRRHLVDGGAGEASSAPSRSPPPAARCRARCRASDLEDVGQPLSWLVQRTRSHWRSARSSPSRMTMHSPRRTRKSSWTGSEW